MKTTMILTALLSAAFALQGFGAEVLVCEKTDKKVQCPAVPAKPKPKKAVVHTVIKREPANQQNQDQDQENEQEQNQSQVVNVYSQPVHERIVEKRVYEARYNNQLRLLAGYGPRGCCNIDGLIGGAGYQRRIAGPFWLGVEVFTNRSYFGTLGIDF